MSDNKFVTVARAVVELSAVGEGSQNVWTPPEDWEVLNGDLWLLDLQLFAESLKVAVAVLEVQDVELDDDADFVGTVKV